MMYTLIGVKVYTFLYILWGWEEINSPHVSCGHIFDVIGFSSKKPVLSVHIAHVTIRGIIAFHDLTPLCKVLVPARALFFMVRWFQTFSRSTYSVTT